MIISPVFYLSGAIFFTFGPIACLMPSYISLAFPVLEASGLGELSFTQLSFAQRIAKFFLSGSFLYWIRADHFAAIKGSITLRFASYLSTLFLLLLPYASIAALYVALRRLFHFVVASVDKLLWKSLLKEEVKCLILSTSFVWPVLIFGNPLWFCIMKLLW